MTVKIAACQVPEIRGDINSALLCIRQYAEKADAKDAQLVCFPECFLQGYLINTEAEQEQARHLALDLSSSAFDDLLKYLADLKPMLVFGLIEIENGSFFNTAVVVHRGHLIGRYRKRSIRLGERFFEPGDSYPIFDIDGLKFGIIICYDSNFPEHAAALAAEGADLIVCPANNMMPYKKAEECKFLHNEVRGKRAKEAGLWLISADVTNERDGRISYGPTAVINSEGSVVEQVPLCQTGMISVGIG